MNVYIVYGRNDDEVYAVYSDKEEAQFHCAYLMFCEISRTYKALDIERISDLIAGETRLQVVREVYNKYLVIEQPIYDNYEEWLYE